MRGRKNSSGNAIVYCILLLAVLVGFASLSVDYGRVQLAKTELRSAADSAARAAAAVMSTSKSAAQAMAVQYAAANKADGTPVAIDPSRDVIFGMWANNQFVPASGANLASANAVQVNCYRTVARGNPIQLVFAAFVGRSTCDVKASATVAFTSQGYGLVGLDYIKMSGGASDSYWSASGSTSTDHGSIASNGPITLSGSATIYGNAHPGVGYSVSGGIVKGSTTPLTSPVSYPVMTAGSFATSNQNNLCPPGTYTNGAFNLSSRQVIMQGGAYYFTSFNMSGSSQITFTGPATIYCCGTFTMSGGAGTFEYLPKNLTVIMVPTPAGVAPGKVTLSGGSALYASVYAPLSPITISGGGAIYGSVLGKSIDMSGGSSVHYDLSLGGSDKLQLVQ